MLSHLFVVALSGAALAEPPPPRPSPNHALAFAVGAAIDAVAFAVGVALVGSDPPGFDQARAGWVTFSAGLALGPFVAHAMAGEWARGAIFSAVPLAATIGNAAVLYSSSTQTIDLTPLNQDQRLVYVFTCVGLLGSIIGLVDAVAFHPKSGVRVTPTVSRTGAGLVLGGSF
ncbi:MAG TPA: hypothetical protein VGH28_15065 [Polyangiaceae bacterium]|jgi:hypothetical protein